MRVMVTVLAGPDDDPTIAFSRTEFVFPEPGAEDSTGHLLDVAAWLRDALEAAAGSVEKQVEALSPFTGGDNGG